VGSACAYDKGAQRMNTELSMIIITNDTLKYRYAVMAHLTLLMCPWKRQRCARVMQSHFCKAAVEMRHPILLQLMQEIKRRNIVHFEGIDHCPVSDFKRTRPPI
jgi:hypothetical protein